MNTVPLTAESLRPALAHIQRNLAFIAAQDKRAYESGKKAKAKGWDRISPFYGKPRMDDCFFAGYDGQPEPEPLGV